MAGESDLERTEPASPRRLEQAREEGQIARSQELSTFAVLLAATGGIWLMGNSLFANLSGLVRSGMHMERDLAFDSHLMLTRLADLGGEALLALLPLLVLIFVAALAAPMMMSGWVFSAKPLQPDFTRLSPAKGLARMFSLHGVEELGKAVAKTLLIGGVAILVLWHNKEGLIGLGAEPLEDAVVHLGRMVSMTVFTILGGMLVIVAADVPFQLWNHHRKLRMTREEVRQEAKETEGDPHLKARIRSLQREAARRRMMDEIPKADVVVTNPTHYAVALRYDDKGMGAPTVVAKGADLLAARIREMAQEHQVPVLEAPPLARALYRHADLGDEIPAALYTAVAEVLAYVYQLRHSRQRGGAEPRFPQALTVPQELDPDGAVA